MIGVWQLVLIFAIVLILFGAGKVPVIMKDLGLGLRAFKKGMEGSECCEEIDISSTCDLDGFDKKKVIGSFLKKKSEKNKKEKNKGKSASVNNSKSGKKTQIKKKN